MPQGSVLSLTLYTLYTNDPPSPEHGCLDIMYADDITQVITTPRKSKHMMKIKVEREIERINKFEWKWKIQTSEEKFKIIPIAQRKCKIIIVNGKEIETSTSGKLLGLSISYTGFVSHICKTITKGNGILSQIRRFSKLTPKMKTMLVKTLLILVMEYPPVPICMASKTQKSKMQTILNKALRFIHCNEEHQLNSEEIHMKYNITPLGISNYEKSLKIWETLRISEPEQYENLVTPHNNSHGWFPKSSTMISTEPPQAVITR